MDHLKKFLNVFNIDAEYMDSTMLNAKYAYKIGMITFATPDIKNVLNITVPVYKDADAVVPPSAARAAVITGKRSFPYSLIASTVCTANVIKDFEDDNRSVPIDIALANSIVRTD